nr:ribonuclease H-like domain-containing protein [Tanacetum cinerariifolium]
VVEEVIQTQCLNLWFVPPYNSMHSPFLRQTSQELLIDFFLRDNFTMLLQLNNKLLKPFIGKAINKVLLAFNSALLYAFSSTLVGGITVSLPSTVFVTIVKNLVFHSKIKHIEIRHHFIRDSNEKKLIQMIKIHTDNNVADLLTKAFNNGKAAQDEIGKSANNLNISAVNLKDSPGAGFKPSGEEENTDAKDSGNKDSEVPSIEEPRVNQKNNANVNSINNINTVSPTNNITGIKDNANDKNIVSGCANDPNMHDLEEIGRFSDAGNDDSGADMNNLDTYFQVSPVPTTRIHKDHPLNKFIGDLHSDPQTRRRSKNLEEHGLMDVNSAFLYGKIKEEVYVSKPLGFQDSDFLDKVYKVEKALCGLHQAPRA